MEPKLFFVFDVESIGLHGEGFSVGGVLITDSGETLKEFCFACKPEEAYGDAEDHLWVMNNVPVPQSKYNLPHPRAVRDAFWSEWEAATAQGALMVTDCGWPVEANFLLTCVDDDRVGRKWAGPYPLHDLASVMLAIGMDPLQEYSREPKELPRHDPLCDARQSARMLLWAFQSDDDREAEACARSLNDSGVEFVTVMPGHLGNINGPGCDPDTV